MAGTIYYRIFIVESERGWGRDYWTEDYNTYEAAKKRIVEINSKNTSRTAPDWYMQAEDRVEVVLRDRAEALEVGADHDHALAGTRVRRAEVAADGGDSVAEAVLQVRAGGQEDHLAGEAVFAAEGRARHRRPLRHRDGEGQRAVFCT